MLSTSTRDDLATRPPCFVFDVHLVLISDHRPFYWLLRISRQEGYVGKTIYCSKPSTRFQDSDFEAVAMDKEIKRH